jgi:hypothetical protein
MFQKLFVAFLLTSILIDASQAAQFGLNGANLRIGYVNPKNPYEPIFGVGAGVNPISFGRYLDIDVDVFASSFSNYHDRDRVSVPQDYSGFAAKIQGKFSVPIRNVRPFIAAGLGLYRWQSEYQPYGYN